MTTMHAIEVSPQTLAALEEQFDPDIATHDAAIAGILDFVEALIEANAKLRSRLAEMAGRAEATDGPGP